MSGLLGGLGGIVSGALGGGGKFNVFDLLKLSTQFRSSDGVPNLKVIASTLAGFVAPTAAAWLADLAGVTEVKVVENLLLGLVTATAVFAAGYLKRPGPNDGVVRDVPPGAPHVEVH